jgi:hypothetical protein
MYLRLKYMDFAWCAQIWIKGSGIATPRYARWWSPYDVDSKQGPRMDVHIEIIRNLVFQQFNENIGAAMCG